MAKTTLTDLKIRKIKPLADKRIEVWDQQIPGFGIRVAPSGAKSFILLYRLHNRAKRMTLGRYPIMGLAEARVQAREALNQLANGHNPQKEKKSSDPYHFEEMVALFVRLHCERLNRGNTSHETARILNNRFAHAWGSRDIREITKGDVLDILDDIVEKGFPSAANHAFSAIRKFFNWCVERDYLAMSPCFGIKMPTKLVSRSRILSDEELALVWQGSKLEGYPYGFIVQLLTLTGQRRSEITELRWTDLNFDQGLWTLPADHNKSGREHVVPLSKTVMEILKSQPTYSETYVFPSQKSPDRTFSGFSKCKKRLDGHCGVTGWTLHDIRRTVATGMAQLKVQPHVVEKLLNHSSGTFSGVAGVYNRFGYLPEIREALELWEAHLFSLLSERAAS